MVTQLMEVTLVNPDLALEPGGSAEVELLIRNRGDAADSAALEVDFDEPTWIALPVSSVALEPGQSRTVRLLVKAPRTAGIRAGIHPLVVHARSMETGATVTAQGAVQIRPYHAFNLSLAPQRNEISAMEKAARYEIRLENAGNAADTFDLSVSDPEGACVYQLPAERVEVAPGETASVPLSVTPRRRLWIASPDVYGFDVKATPVSGSSPPEHGHGLLEYRALCSPFVFFVVLLALAWGGFFLWRSQQVPDISLFRANPAEIVAGEPVTLEWAVSNADRLFVKDGTTNVMTQVDVAANKTVRNPGESTRYTLVAEDDRGHEVRRNVDVTVTAAAAQNPPRILNFHTSTSQVNAGQPVVLSWKVADVQSLVLAPLGTKLDPALPSLQVIPTQTTTYQLVARNGSNPPAYSRPVTVTVIPPPNPAAPKISLFVITPPGVQEGEPFTLTWSVVGAAAVEISGIGPVPSDGSRTFQARRGTHFTLTATAPSGLQSQKDVRVNVVPPARIVQFVAQPASITAGGHATLLWNVHNADSVSIDNIGPVDREGSQDVSPAQTTTYHLKAIDAAGHSVDASATVTVQPAAVAPTPSAPAQP